ncbi:MULTISPECIES: Dabb family protein [Mycobacterium]|uniref:Dabb family protein n=1 Tax=Mycobacterium TaxID=1763 RepID=UPI00025D5910|nr:MULTISPECIES: Dabb family protein [Mycobacterium]AFJ35740.1 stress responsive A/B barrel domain family protein [Mycobacterium sp. MOTT36Y]ASX00899.1 stress responsive protein [Mycobacterium intracellulare subsp. chimaera]PBA60489.1 stress responsive protein [Mycobacterium intracellulare subsp. chimaera]
MYSVTRLIDVAEPDRDRILDELRGAIGAEAPLRSVVQPTLPGSRNGGDVLVHLRFATQDQCDRATNDLAAILADPSVGRVNGAGYAGTPVRCGEKPGTVYRTLLLRVQPDTPEATIARFERELSSMPRYLPTIRAWQLSRVTAAVGTSSWTHVFEQEFADVEALMGPYLMHPIHWAVVDRWFDPETTDVIIRDRVCHSFCAIADPVLI